MKTKRSIAVLIRQNDQILSLRRPEDDDELPGVWGLPAGSFREGEYRDELIGRIGRDKLGVSLTPLSKLADGVQDRSLYHLEMELWEVSMDDVPTRGHWQWTLLDVLRPGMEAGSLCCRLALQTKEGEKL